MGERSGAPSRSPTTCSTPISTDVARDLLHQVRAAGGVERARAKAQQLAESAVAALETVPPSPYREALRDLAFISADRMS